MRKSTSGLCKKSQNLRLELEEALMDKKTTYAQLKLAYDELVVKNRSVLSGFRNLTYARGGC